MTNYAASDLFADDPLWLLPLYETDATFADPTVFAGQDPGSNQISFTNPAVPHDANALPSQSGPVAVPESYASLLAPSYRYDSSSPGTPYEQEAEGLPPARWTCNEPGCTNKTGFDNESKLKRHQDLHKLNFKCTICGNKHGSKSDLNRHSREVHSRSLDGKPMVKVACAERTCVRLFSRYDNMREHCKKRHGITVPPKSASKARSQPADPLSPSISQATFPSSASCSESEPTTPPNSGNQQTVDCRTKQGLLQLKQSAEHRRRSCMLQKRRANEQIQSLDQNMLDADQDLRFAEEQLASLEADEARLQRTP